MRYLTILLLNLFLSTSLIGAPPQIEPLPAVDTHILPGPSVNDSPQLKMAKLLAKGFSQDPSVVKPLFSSPFIEKISWEAIEGLFISLHKKVGTVVTVKVDKVRSDKRAVIRFLFKKNKFLPANFLLSSDNSQIESMWVGGPQLIADSFDEVMTGLKSLNGEVAISIFDLSKPEFPILAFNNEKPMDVASSFKLYVLGALHSQIISKKMAWDAVVRLNDKLYSFPSGILHTWPNDSPVTIHSLAALMIARSDNTATDLLIHTVGRENVEAQLSKMSAKTPDLSIPLLTTLECFSMELDHEDRWKSRYLAAKVPGRRSMLKKLGEQKRPVINRLSDLHRVWPLGIGWFFSTDDLSKAITWLYNASGKDIDSPLMKVLSINPGMSLDEDKWPYVGYKGGSSGGALNVTYIVKNSRGKWYTLSFSWNDRTNELDDRQFDPLLMRCFKLLK